MNKEQFRLLMDILREIRMGIEANTDNTISVIDEIGVAISRLGKK